MELRVGNKYRLGRKIGSGSFGEIYQGMQEDHIFVGIIYRYTARTANQQDGEKMKSLCAAHFSLVCFLIDRHVWQMFGKCMTIHQQPFTVIVAQVPVSLYTHEWWMSRSQQLFFVFNCFQSMMWIDNNNNNKFCRYKYTKWWQGCHKARTGQNATSSTPVWISSL